MRKRISVGACVVTVMICCIVTFQATYIGLYNRFEKKCTEKICSRIFERSNIF